MKRILFLAAAVFLVLALIVACGPEEADPTGTLPKTEEKTSAPSETGQTRPVTQDPVETGDTRDTKEDPTQTADAPPTSSAEGGQTPPTSSKEGGQTPPASSSKQGSYDPPAPTNPIPTQTTSRNETAVIPRVNP